MTVGSNSRKQRWGRRHRQPLEISMTPLIDVVFLLLIFFVWTASFQVVEERLPTVIAPKLASGNTTESDAQPVDFEPLIVRVLWIEGAPQWTVSGEPKPTLAEVTATLQSVASVKPDLPVIIDPVADVPLGNVIDVYDRTRQAGLSKIQFAAEVGS